MCWFKRRLDPCSMRFTRICRVISFVLRQEHLLVPNLNSYRYGMWNDNNQNYRGVKQFANWICVCYLYYNEFGTTDYESLLHVLMFWIVCFKIPGLGEMRWFKYPNEIWFYKSFKGIWLLVVMKLFLNLLDDFLYSITFSV